MMARRLTACTLLILTVTLTGMPEGLAAGQKSIVTKATPEETRLLYALEKLRVASEAGASFESYAELIQQAMVELNIVKRSKKRNDFFLFYANSSVGAYRNAKILWEEKLKFGQAATMDQDIQHEWKRGGESLDKAYELIK